MSSQLIHIFRTNRNFVLFQIHIIFQRQATATKLILLLFLYIFMVFFGFVCVCMSHVHYSWVMIVSFGQYILSATVVFA